MAIYARTTIPAAVLLLRVIHTHLHHVRTYLYIWRNINEKRRVTIGMPANLLSVDINLRVHIDTLEIKAQLFSLSVFAKGERLAIPPFTSRQVAAVITSRSILAECLLYAPVVG